MRRRLRLLFRRAAIAILLLGGALAHGGCNAILGLDDGLPKDAGIDGSDDATMGGDVSGDAGSDETQGNDGSDAAGGDDGADADQAGDDMGQVDAGDASLPDTGDACIPDPNWCTTHCGNAPDNCNIGRGCANNCQSGWLCDAWTHLCVCQTDPTWCKGRCGPMTDNCGRAIDCGTCSSGLACTRNTCGCTPQPNPCGAMQCGRTRDSCMLSVYCGMNGLCPGGGICQPGGTCCTPNSNPCAGRCGVSVDNGCGQMIQCPATCSGGEVCDSQGRCCAPTSCGNACGNVANGCGSWLNCTCSSGVCYLGQCCVSGGGCSGNCLDDCGQPSSACCQDGGPPTEGGSCGPLCPGDQGCCPGMVCNAASNCVTSCSSSYCRTTDQCCYGLTCTFVAGAGSGGVPPPPMGQCL